MRTAQVQAESCVPLNRPKDRQVRIPQATCASFIEANSAVEHQTRPHHCDAANAGRRYPRLPRDCHRMAAAFGPRIPCRRRPQEAWLESRVRDQRQGPSLSHKKSRILINDDSTALSVVCAQLRLSFVSGASVASARPGPSAMQTNASSAHPDFHLANMTSFSLLAATTRRLPRRLRLIVVGTLKVEQAKRPVF
jgi:hypothetical protein